MTQEEVVMEYAVDALPESTTTLMMNGDDVACSYGEEETDCDYTEDYTDGQYYQQDQGELAVLPQHEQNAIDEQQQYEQKQQEEAAEDEFIIEQKYHPDDDISPPPVDSLMSPSESSTNSRKVSEIHKEKYNEFRLSLAADAAQLGKLTRLNEHVVTAVATEQTKKEEQDWAGIKAAHNLDSKSAFIRVCIEAAAMGRLHRGNEKQYTVTNYEETEEDLEQKLDEDANEIAKGMIDQILKAMEETEYQLDEILNELEVLQEVDPGSIADFLPILDQLKTQVDALNHHLSFQPNSTSTRLDKVIEEQREDISKSWAHHLTVIEDLEKFQSTKDTFDDHNLAVIPLFEEPKFEKPTMFITKGKQRKVIPAQAAKEGLLKMELLASGNDIRIRSTCHCPYCKNPSSFQTQSYKQMRERKQANDNTLRKELVGLAKKRPAKKMTLRKSHSERPLKPTPNFTGGMQHGLSWKSPRTQRRNFREAEARKKMLEQQKALMEQNLPAIDESADNKLEEEDKTKLIQENEEIKSNDDGSSRHQRKTSSLDFALDGLMSLISPRSAKRTVQQAAQKKDEETKKPEKSTAERFMDWLSPSTKKKNKVEAKSSTKESKKSTFAIPALPGLDESDEENEDRPEEKHLGNNTDDNTDTGTPFAMPALPSLDDDDDDDEEEEDEEDSTWQEDLPADSAETNESLPIPGLPALPMLSEDEEEEEEEDESVVTTKLEESQKENEPMESPDLISTQPNARNMTNRNSDASECLQILQPFDLKELDASLKEEDGIIAPSSDGVPSTHVASSEHWGSEQSSPMVPPNSQQVQKNDLLCSSQHSHHSEEKLSQSISILDDIDEAGNSLSSRSFSNGLVADTIQEEPLESDQQGNGLREQWDCTMPQKVDCNSHFIDVYTIPLKGGDSSHLIEFEYLEESIASLELENSQKPEMSSSAGDEESALRGSQSLKSDGSVGSSRSKSKSKRSRRKSRGESLSSDLSVSSKNSKSSRKSKKSSRKSRRESVSSQVSVGSQTSKSSRSKRKSRSSRSRSKSLSVDESMDDDESIPPPPELRAVKSEGYVKSSRKTRTERKSDRSSQRKSRSKSMDSDGSDEFGGSMPAPLPLKSFKSDGSVKSSRSSKSKRKSGGSSKSSRSSKSKRSSSSRSISPKPGDTKKSSSSRSISPMPAENKKSSSRDSMSPKSRDSLKSSESSKRGLSRHLSLMPDGALKPERRSPKRSNSIGGKSNDAMLSPRALTSAKSDGYVKSSKSSSKHSRSPEPADSVKSSKSSKRGLSRHLSLLPEDARKPERRSTKGSSGSSQSRKRELSRHLSLLPEGTKKPERRSTKRSSSIESGKSGKSGKSSKSRSKLSRHLSMPKEGSTKPERRRPKEDMDDSPKSSNKSNRRSSHAELKRNQSWWQLDFPEDEAPKPPSRGVQRSRSLGAASAVRSGRLSTTHRASLKDEGSSRPKISRHSSMPRRPPPRSLDPDSPNSAKSNRRSSRQDKIKSDGSVKSSRSKKKLSRHQSMPKQGSSRPERRSSKRSSRDDASKRDRTVSPPKRSDQNDRVSGASSKRDRSTSPPRRSFVAPANSPSAGRPFPQESPTAERKEHNGRAAPEQRQVRRTASGRIIPGLEEYRTLVKMAVAETASDVSSLVSSQSSLDSQECEIDGPLPPPPPTSSQAQASQAEPSHNSPPPSPTPAKPDSASLASF